ncbi:tetratricopeptide repeat protein [Carboxylicivirga linearis]|uniref:Tetratricopeptide repeat protein n=1 Tax=Carboxylicivirga linearis TaxID=1628157 RepID=A0ABS5JWS5_9BACT|nr:hypothetical protein [Carboxylicivirga linearis]MBS2099377.1 hypothetical protein [Carboxylicivirga linearis]
MHLILFKNRRLERADYASTHGKYQMAIKLAKPMVHSRNKVIAFKSNRICGLSLYKRKKYNESIVYLKEACHLGNYRHDWYNLAMAYAFSGKLNMAEQAFQNIYRTNVQPGYMYAVPVPGLIFQYTKALIQKQFMEAAKKRTRELKQMYQGVGNDITKQVQRGLPSYPMFQKEIELKLQIQ